MPDFDRASALGRLASEQFDVLVVGGGITGAGVALDAASRGMKTALVELADFAQGTSSRSSKLVHGGLRYLQQREFGLVHESLVERQRLLHNAPHLVTPLPFLIPLFGRHGVVKRAVSRSYATALWLYDVAGGWRIGSRHYRVDAAQALAHLPTLRVDRLVAGFVYPDAQTDDARLTLAVLRTAVLDHGAVAANYTSCVEIRRDAGGTVLGARLSPAVRPGSSGSFGEAARGPDFDIDAKVVVNATGVWADQLIPGAPALRPAKGVHVTVPSDLLPCDIAAVLPVTADHRSIFVVPWPGCDLTYIGTTDTSYEGPLDNPMTDAADVEYLLAAVNAATTSALRPEHVRGVWAGLRPLLADGNRQRTADLSRRHAVTAVDGVVTVTGGKLTTYRKMAQDTTDAVRQDLGRGRRTSRTADLALRGAPAVGGTTKRWRRGRKGPAEAGVVPDHLARRYGTEAPQVLALAQERPELLEPLAVGLPYLRAEVVWAARHEMAQSVDDVLSRRTRARLQDARAAVAAAPEVARLLADELGWDPDHAADQAEQFSRSVHHELDQAGL